MDVMLIKTTFNEEVHGTSNGKRTGCGVNLLKAGNDTKFLQTGRMTDLKEITCEKCKEKIAKEIIKSDKKEMDQLLKEERARRKAGIEDEGIVPLGNTTARITNAPAPEREEAPVRQERPAPQAAAPQQEAAPAPSAPRQTIPGTGVPMDDSLAQFAIQKPAEEEPETTSSNDDFLAQFAVNKPEAEENKSGDDFLTQFAVPNSAAQNQPAGDDIMNMFSVNNTQKPVEQMPAETETAPVHGMYDNNSDVIDVAEENISPAQPNAWDAFANQFFGMGAEAPAGTPAAEEAPAPMEMDDMPSVADNIAPAHPQPTVPALDDISIPSAAPQTAAPVLDDISAPALDDLDAEEEEYEEEYEEEEFEEEAEDEIPEIEDITPVQPAPQPTPVQNVAPVQPAPQPTPVQNVAPVQPAPQPAPVQNAAPVQPAPQPAPVQNAAPVQPAPMPAGQFVTVPQITGYDQNGQPMYAYMQMQITGYDQNGQPMLVPVGQPMGAPAFAPQYGAVMAAAAASAGSVNTSKYGKYGLTPGQKIAAEAAAKGNQIDANISKIAVHEHTKNTSQSFINAISVAKDKANQSLTDTQGLKAGTPIIGSVEDMLAQLGDTSEKEKQMKKAAEVQNAPVFQEYTGYSRPVRRSPSSSAPSNNTPVYMSEKDRKKQAKIDAKFQKKMAKNKG